MDKRGSTELLDIKHNSKNASSDSLNSDSKSSSLNSKMGQEAVSFNNQSKSNSTVRKKLFSFSFGKNFVSY